MILVWLFVWALAGTPTLSGWWLVTLFLAAIFSLNGVTGANR